MSLTKKEELLGGELRRMDTSKTSLSGFNSERHTIFQGGLEQDYMLWKQFKMEPNSFPFAQRTDLNGKKKDSYKFFKLSSIMSNFSQVHFRYYLFLVQFHECSNALSYP